MRWHKGETWIDTEELAYTTATGTPHGSQRKGYVRCHDGKLRTATLGVPDTFYTIPGFIWSNGKRINGWVSLNEQTNEFEFTFRKEEMT